MGTPAGLAVIGSWCVGLLVARRPDVVFRAELWGDDGWSWYPDAYRLGFRCLTMPVGGYLNTLQRLGGLAAQVLPLTSVPTFFACAAICVQVMPALFLLSPRMHPVWPNPAARLAFALLYVLLPDNVETFANLTNAPWNLALVALQIIIATPPRGRFATAFDAAVLVISGLSGPFCLLLMPVACWQTWRRRARADVWHACILAATAAVQLWFIVHGAQAHRAPGPLGAGPRMLARVFAMQVLVGGELGLRTAMTLPSLPAWQSNAPLLLAAFAGGGLGVVALMRGGTALRALALFAALVSAAAMVSPQASATGPQWAVLTHPPVGSRYFYFAILAWMAVLFTLAADRRRWLGWTGRSLLALVVGWAIPTNFLELPMPHTDFVRRARAFETSPLGTRMEFPVVPAGLSPMVLVKGG